MASGQFQIPSQERFVDSSTIQEIESSFDARDVQEMNEQRSPYEVVKDIEQKLESYRANATEANLPKLSAVDRARSAVTNLFVSSSAPRTVHDKLVEAESIIGGSQLGTHPEIISQRFWYHQGDWFYESHDATGPMVARYQFIDGQAHKLVDGKPYYFADGEIQNLYRTIELYHDQVFLQLYASKNDYDLTA
jgi:hypothetical protein